MAFLTKTGFRMNSRSEGVSTENHETLCPGIIAFSWGLVQFCNVQISIKHDHSSVAIIGKNSSWEVDLGEKGYM